VNGGFGAGVGTLEFHVPKRARNGSPTGLRAAFASSETAVSGRVARRRPAH
jgi:hypothetical protein